MKTAFLCCPCELDPLDTKSGMERGLELSLFGE